jgi:hypothetical protein
MGTGTASVADEAGSSGSTVVGDGVEVGGGNVEVDNEEPDVTAIEIALEGVVSEVAEGAVGDSAATETSAAVTTACVVSISEGRPGAAATRAEGTRFAKVEDGVRDEAVSLVPIVEDVVSGGGASCAASVVEVEEGGGGRGGASVVVVCICAASCVVEGGVDSVEESTTSVEMSVDVAAVRARERVHRRPFTVVVRSCGVAMQKTHS